ncbi:uncharacterized protein METZ01_LOCUS478691, partial [marine metagenome]
MHAPNTLVAELMTRRPGGRSVVTALVGVVLLLLAGGTR